MTFRGFDPIGNMRSAWRGLSGQAGRMGRKARRMGRGKAGIAAVEFALILPMMLVLYFGCAVLAQGLDAGRKTQLLAKTLSDLTAQVTPGTYFDGNCAANPAATPNPATVACVTDKDLQQIFGSASAVLYPFNGATTMTISEIIFDNQATTSGGKTVVTNICCDAKLVWSAASGTGATPRTCQTFSSTGSGMSYIPAGLYPAASTAYTIVADVTYAYTPSFGFVPFSWGQPANAGNGYTIKMTTYMTPRGGANAPIYWTPDNTIISAAQRSTCSPNVP
jgi:Flp pilus assembly protein TadG